MITVNLMNICTTPCVVYLLAIVTFYEHTETYISRVWINPHVSAYKTVNQSDQGPFSVSCSE